MRVKYLSSILGLSLCLYTTSTYANVNGDIYIPGYKFSPSYYTDQDYTVITDYSYPNILFHTQKTIGKLINYLHLVDPNKQSPDYLNTLVEVSGDYFHNKPYITTGALGEGDWCSASLQQKGCIHIQQDPIYRSDGFNCVTLVNFIMALIKADNLTEFNHNIVNIAYGADQFMSYRTHPTDTIAYYNRNNFTSADFNPVNQQNNRLVDIYNNKKWRQLFKMKKTSTIITRGRWFAFQAKPDVIQSNVRVLPRYATQGSKMVDKFSTHYGAAYGPERVAIGYIPKSVLVTKNSDNSYKVNQQLINQIPAPAVVEIVRDSKKWNINGTNIRKLIGSGINVSHLGLLYRKTFHRNKLIYRKIYCQYDNNHHKQCQVTPVICHQQYCTRTMMLAATNAYPDGYIWSYKKQRHAKQNSDYFCTQSLPDNATALGYCNRVMAMPLGDYLASYQYGNYIYMNNSSIVGINIEKVINPNK